MRVRRAVPEEAGVPLRGREEGIRRAACAPSGARARPARASSSPTTATTPPATICATSTGRSTAASTSCSCACSRKRRICTSISSSTRRRRCARNGKLDYARAVCGGARLRRPGQARSRVDRARSAAAPQRRACRRRAARRNIFKVFQFLSARSSRRARPSCRARSSRSCTRPSGAASPWSISDFYDPAGYEEGLNLLRYHRFEPTVLQVWSAARGAARRCAATSSSSTSRRGESREVTVTERAAGRVRARARRLVRRARALLRRARRCPIFAPTPPCRSTSWCCACSAKAAFCRDASRGAPLSRRSAPALRRRRGGAGRALLLKLRRRRRGGAVRRAVAARAVRRRESTALWKRLRRLALAGWCSSIAAGADPVGARRSAAGGDAARPQRSRWSSTPRPRCRRPSAAAAPTRLRAAQGGGAPARARPRPATTRR